MNKSVSCPLCSGKKLKKYKRFNSAEDHRTFVQCAHCRHVFAGEFSGDKLEEFYSQAYYPSADDPAIQQWIDSNRRVWDELVREIIQFHPQIRTLLDFGAGTGGFLECFKAQSEILQDIHAVENAPSAKENLIRRFPDGKIYSVLEECDFGDFDCISSLQCFEHLSNPLEECIELRKKMAVGGIMVITVPNRFSLRTLLLGRRDVYNAGNPTHLQFFSIRSMRAMLKKAGFKEIRRIANYPANGNFFRRFITFICRRLGISGELRFICR